MMTRVASLVLCLAAAAQSYLVYVPRAPHSLYQLPWLAAGRGAPTVPPFHGDTDTLLLVTEPSVAPVVVDLLEFDCPADGSFPDMESGCESYFVCAGGNVS